MERGEDRGSIVTVRQAETPGPQGKKGTDRIVILIFRRKPRALSRSEAEPRKPKPIDILHKPHSLQLLVGILIPKTIPNGWSKEAIALYQKKIKPQQLP